MASISPWVAGLKPFMTKRKVDDRRAGGVDDAAGALDGGDVIGKGGIAAGFRAAEQREGRRRVAARCQGLSEHRPQLPAITVVTPWLVLGDTAVSMTARSSWVWVSTWSRAPWWASGVDFIAPDRGRTQTMECTARHGTIGAFAGHQLRQDRGIADFQNPTFGFYFLAWPSSRS